MEWRDRGQPGSVRATALATARLHVHCCTWLLSCSPEELSPGTGSQKARGLVSRPSSWP
jgi:hypothetical protein